jgi:paraquat-inducible protein B
VSDHPETSPAAATPEFRAAQRWNIVWVIPILAVLIGGWLVFQNISSRGPEVRVSFETADGIAAGKTEVRCRSVRVGFVSDVVLSEDLQSVLVHLRLDPEASNLLKDGTRFWVVRPRVSTTDISGLGTLITGAYIELDPGAGNQRVTEFTGLETPPSTSSSVPGRRLVLAAEQAGSLIAGSPIYFRGFEVGRIESRRLSGDGVTVEYDAFIREDYADLVTENSRFWNTSGIDITAGAEGFRVRTPSFQAMVSGGAAFAPPDGLPPGAPAEDGAKFTLFRDRESAMASSFAPTLRYLLLFDQSVRGLAVGGPVEFRGIPIGRVADISFDYIAEASGDRRIPVLVEVDPSPMRAEASKGMADSASGFIERAVARGLRAALKTANLLTGTLYVDFDYYGDAVPAEVEVVGELIAVPTISSGFAQLEAKLSAVLDKLQSLPLDETLGKIGLAAEESATTVAEARAALKEIEAVAASARQTLEDPDFRELPADLRVTLADLQRSVASMGPDGSIQGDMLRTLDELRASLRSLKSLSTTIDEKPNSLIFGREGSGNPVPRAPVRGR